MENRKYQKSELKIGDRVRIEDRGYLYSEYREMALQMGLKNWKRGYGSMLLEGLTDNILGMTGKIIAKKNANEDVSSVLEPYHIYGIRLQNEREIIIAHRGLIRGLIKVSPSLTLSNELFEI